MHESIVIQPLTTPQPSANGQAGFQGTLGSCLTHFATNHPDIEDRRIFAKMLGMPYHPTVYSWMKGGNLPTGLNRVKLTHALYLLGYKIYELEMVVPDVHIFGQHLLAGTTTVEAAAELFETTPQTLYRACLGRSGLGESILAFMVLFNSDKENGILIFNCTHPQWVKCDARDTAICAFQENIVFHVLLLEMMPQETTAHTRLMSDNVLKLMSQWLIGSAATNALKGRVLKEAKPKPDKKPELTPV